MSSALSKQLVHVQICNFSLHVCTAGSEEEMNKMMGDYIAGTHDLFGVAIDPPQSTETDTPPSPNTPPPSSVTTPPQSIEPSPPLRPSSATVAATASPMAPPRRKKRKLSGKINTDAEHLQANQHLGVRFLSPITVIVSLSY